MIKEFFTALTFLLIGFAMATQVQVLRELNEMQTITHLASYHQQLSSEAHHSDQDGVHTHSHRHASDEPVHEHSHSDLAFAIPQASLAQLTPFQSSLSLPGWTFVRRLNSANDSIPSCLHLETTLRPPIA